MQKVLSVLEDTCTGDGRGAGGGMRNAVGWAQSSVCPTIKGTKDLQTGEGAVQVDILGKSIPGRKRSEGMAPRWECA